MYICIYICIHLYIHINLYIYIHTDTHHLCACVRADVCFGPPKTRRWGVEVRERKCKHRRQGLRFGSNPGRNAQTRAQTSARPLAAASRGKGLWVGGVDARHGRAWSGLWVARPYQLACVSHVISIYIYIYIARSIIYITIQHHTLYIYIYMYIYICIWVYT